MRPLHRFVLPLLLLLLTAMAAAAQAPKGTAANRVATSIALVEDLAAGHADRAVTNFDATMRQALPAARLVNVWDSITRQIGPFQKILSTNQTKQNGFDIVTVRSRFAKATVDVRVVFDGPGEVAGLFFKPESSQNTAQHWKAPEYADPAKFHEHAIIVSDGQWKLPGTLTIPDGKGPFPGVVLVAGSGPEDQDESIGPNKPFKDLAWGLASNGIAVLRYDKRTYVYKNTLAANPTGFTIDDEVTNDARAAVSLLAAQPDVNPHCVFVLGHSLGAMMTPKIAAGDPQVAGIILMGAPAGTLGQSLLRQLQYLHALQPPEATEAQVEAAERAVRQAASPGLQANDTVRYLGIALPGSYVLSLRGYSQTQVAAQLSTPILVLQAGRDYQVTMQDFDAWKRALAHDPKATFHLFPSLFHLFMPSAAPGTSLGTPADYQHPGHVAPEVIGGITAWIQSADRRQ